MQVHVLEADESDMLRLFEIASLAFGQTEPFWNATWPQHWTEAGRQTGTERFLDTKRSNPHAKYMKAVHSSSGKILGVAKWSIITNENPKYDKPRTSQVDDMDQDETKSYQQYLATQFFAERRDAIARSNNNIMCLDILAVDPSYQRRGIACALVAWGTRTADGTDLEIIVEGSAAGRNVYEKHGFVLTKKIQIQVPSNWQHLGGQDYLWLVRPKRKPESVASTQGTV